MKLSQNELRVLGVLMEKAKTTPDQYPLSLNGLTSGCNQKTNREPVMSLSEADVQEALDSLAQKNLVSEVRFGGRVPKYQHRFYGTEFSAYKFNEQQAGILCVLFLRGPQTPGELRTRTNRLCEFSDVHETEQVLQRLNEISGGPYILRLEREPGRRESRFAHLFGEAEIDAGVAEHSAATTEALASTSEKSLQQRVDELELTVEELQTVVAELKTVLQDLTE